MVLRAAVRRPRRLPHRRPGRDAADALRPARGRERAGGRLPHRVLRHEVRHVLPGRVHRHHADLGADRRRCSSAAGSGPWLPPIVWFLLKTLALHLPLHPAAGVAAAAAVRPADGLRLEGHAAAGAAEPAGHRAPSGRLRRHADVWPVEAEAAMPWQLVAECDEADRMLVHAEKLWRSSCTLSPAGDGPVPGAEALPAAAVARADHPLARPRRRGALRGLLPLRRRLPGGLHRPAGDRGRARPALPGVLPHQLLALHLLRLLRGGLPDLRHPAHARLRDERVRPRRAWSTRRRTCSSPGRASTTATTSTASPGWRSRARTRAKARQRRTSA